MAVIADTEVTADSVEGLEGMVVMEEDLVSLCREDTSKTISHDRN